MSISLCQHKRRWEYVPKIPVPQTLTHAALQDSVGVWPSAYQSVQTTATQTISLGSFCTSHTSTTL
jgi:hypothetical protein